MNIIIRRFILIALVTLVGLALMWPPVERLKLGIDLSGGTILVYKVKDGGRPDFRMDDLISALKRRVNPEGVLDIPIRKVGSNRIEIILPQAKDEDVEEVKRRITDVGSLEFHILANRKHDNAQIERALRSPIDKAPTGYKWAKLGELITGENPEFDATRVKDPNQVWRRDNFAGTLVELKGKNSLDREQTIQVPIVSNKSNELTVNPEKAQAIGEEQARNIKSLTSFFKTISSYRIDYNPSRIQASPNAIVREEPRGPGYVDRYLLFKQDRLNITGAQLSHVYSTQDERVQPAVGFVFNASGGRKFGEMTRRHLPEENGSFLYHLAILLDNLVMSAPVIKSEIREQGIIENMPPKEVDHLISILRAGSLPASLDPIPLLEEKVGPTLGKDTIDKGVRAIVISMLVVPIFMIVYYRFAGAVAVVALVLNMVLLLGSMALIQASFTLPGLAGLALTIGMAVDANVLIFERMREEMERGASMAQTIRNGFAKAWVTIFDSNVTTVLSGLVLYAIGTEEIKGFALTLIIGLVWNLFTAVFVSRVIFDFWYLKGWLRKMSFAKIFGETNIDFIRPRKIFMTASVLVIGAGLVYTYFQYRSNQLLNIDFTGGSLVTIQLNGKSPEVAGLGESQRSEFVRAKASAVLPDVSVEMLNVGNEQKGLRFNIRTTEDTLAEVQSKILDQFRPYLAALELTRSAPAPIPKADGGKGPAEKEKTTAIDSSERFAGGMRYFLRPNRAIEPSAVQSEFAKILTAAGITDPDSRFEVLRPIKETDIQQAGANGLILTTNLDQAQADSMLDGLAKGLANNKSFLFERLTNFGEAVAADTRTLAIIAIVASWAIIIAYLWFRFKSLTFGLAAVVALVHDVLITLGAVAISPYKIDLPMVAAFLTIIGFSVNDTIVIFDRIREIRGKSPYLTEQVINAAVNQTLSRTLLTSFTAILVVGILYLFGGEGLRGFSFCLLVGFVSGVYSTIYIASPVLIDWMRAPPANTPAQGRKAEIAGKAA